MINLLWGPDEYSLYEAVESIKSNLEDNDMLETNTTRLDGVKLSIDELKNTCDTIPFMAPKRLVIVKGLLQRFEGKRTRARSRKPASAEQTEEYEAFTEYIPTVPPTTELVLIDDTEIKPGNVLLAALSKKKGLNIRAFPVLKGQSLRQWIRDFVIREGSCISPEAVRLIAELTGNNLRVTASEITKLILFTQGETIEEQHVRAVVSYAQETNIFTMVDAVLTRNSQLAGRLLQKLLDEGAAPAYILYMITRQVRLIVLVRDMLNRKCSTGEIQAKPGLSSPFVLKKTSEQAQKYSLPYLHTVYRHLLETDHIIKTSNIDSELSLHLLIASLCGEKTMSRSAK